MKVNLRDNQIPLWQELAELIGAKNPADAIAYVGAVYLQGIIAEVREKSASPPPSSKPEQPEPKKTLTVQTSTKTEFDDLFDSIKQ